MTSLAQRSNRSHTSGRPGALAATCVVLGLGLAAPGAAKSAPVAAAKKAPAAEFPAARLIIEFNASAEDVGVQFFLDADEWQTVRILDPSGKEVFQSTARGRLLDQGGGTELFVESVEPELTELPLDEFFEIFPAGTYTFLGRTPDGERLASTVEFTHVIPAGPEVVLPVGSTGDECTENVPIPAVIAWNDVTTTIDDSPLEIDHYEVIVENDDSNFDVHLPPGADTSITVPTEFLTPGTEYIFEVLAIEAGGNQTITEGCFVTSE
jgi:hypothetical protein